MSKLSLSALSIAPRARDWLEQTRQARVLHVFEFACNLINREGEILALVTPEIGAGPFALVVDCQMPGFSNYITADTPITILADKLKLGQVTIRFDQARQWHPRPQWENVHRCLITVLAQLPTLHSLIQTHASPDSLTQLLPRSRRPTLKPVRSRQSAFSTRVREAALPAVDLLCAGIINRDMETCCAGARELAGLGAGLTPAGDDFLLGVIYASWVITPPQRAAPIVKAIATTAAPLTTPLSAAWLNAAARGEASCRWHSFLDSLISGDSAAVKKSALDILAIGHTSGADALAGFITVLDGFAIFHGET